VDSGRPKEPCIRWGSISACEGAILMGKRGGPLYSIGDSAVKYAKTAEPIEMPFGTWTRLGLRKHYSMEVDIGDT